MPASLVRSTQPAVQAASPAEQVQAPLTQLVDTGQTTPQLPQLAASLVRSLQPVLQAVAPAGQPGVSGWDGDPGLAEHAGINEEPTRETRKGSAEDRMPGTLTRSPPFGARAPPLGGHPTTASEHTSTHPIAHRSVTPP